MAIKKSVFGSRGEERGFRSIEHTWGEEYRLFPQVPFSALFEPDDTSRSGSNFFFKTSVDYTLCTKGGLPLLAIDFDGLGRGFNRDGQYVEVETTTDPYRKLKFDFKLRYAMKSDFPYYIVASDEFKHVDHETNLTIVDGLIGYELAHKDFKERMPSVVEVHQDAIDNLAPHDRQEYIQNLVIEQEVTSDLKYNRITQKTYEVQYKAEPPLRSLVRRWSHQNVHEPELPDLESPGIFGSIESFKARLAAIKDIERVGCVYTLLDTPIGEVSETAWMRNIGHISQCLVITQDIAELLVWTKLSRLLRRRTVGP